MNKQHSFAQHSKHSMDELLSPLSTSPCDRRMSRAARELLRRQLLYTPSYQQQSNTLRAAEHANVWDMLEVTLSATNACPLLQPQHDVLRAHETHSHVMASQTTRFGVIHARRGKRQHANDRVTNPWWYRCALCGKTFVTRYYLDAHLARRHDMDENHNNATICPATHWCEFLSTSHCQEMALELEPYYGPGSGGYGGPEAPRAQRHWQEQVQQTCNAIELRHAQSQCREVVQACFVEDDASVLMRTLCASITCHGRLHRIWAPASAPWLWGRTQNVPQHLHHRWHDEWHYWHQRHHEMGVLGTMLVLAVVGWCCVMQCWHHHRGGIVTSSHKRNRLLYGKQRQNTTSIWSKLKKQHWDSAAPTIKAKAS